MTFLNFLVPIRPFKITKEKPANGNRFRSQVLLLLYDTAHGTSANAFSASGTQGVINGRLVVGDMNGAVRTSFFALFTADTAGLAGASGVLAQVAVEAFDMHALGFFVRANDAFGTNGGTQAAPHAFFMIDMRHTVFNHDGIIRTHRRTIAEANTAVVAHALAAVIKVARRTGMDAVVFKDVRGGIVGAFSVPLCPQRFHILEVLAQNGAERLRNSASARYTEVGF